jgi:UDP-N-acetylmuramoyl-tripeptide--D-alanyl-D-alanine ligase
MDLFVPKFIQYQLYLLQLENYELGRYWKLLFKKGFFPKRRNIQRKELVWTAKAKALTVMAVGVHALLVVLFGAIALSVKPGTDNFFTAVIFAAIVFLPFYFILFSLALIAIKPLDTLAKKRITTRAQVKISAHEGKIKIIGVAGSYGKTTMKEVLAQVLDARFSVLSTPESVNTPVGIGRWVLNKLKPDTEILIVEMGEHYENDIKEICEIVRPDIAVVTGINESHLERMKKMETVIATVFEIVSNSKQAATVLLNANDHRVMENYKKFVWPDHKIERFKIEDLRLRNFSAEKLVWECEADGVGKVEINLVGEYALGDVSAAIKIGKILGMADSEIISGIKNIKPVEHRLEPIKSPGDILVIDDAYNGNPDGVKEAIKVLSRFQNRRKVVITPGLVEMGKSAADVHRIIGKELAGVADVVVLIKNSVTPFIAEGILSVPSRPNPNASEGERRDLLNHEKQIPRSDALTRNGNIKIIWFNTALEAHAELKNILKPGDVVLFQNDWGDQYV